MTQAAARAARFLGCLIVLSSACRKHEAPVADKAAGVSLSGAPGTSGVEKVKRSPLPQSELPTTAPSIAMGNFEGSLNEAEGRLAKKDPHSALLYVMMARLHLAHGRIVGKLDEYERAAQLMTSAVQLAPKDPRVLVAQSEVASTFHRFNEALSDLAEAEKLGARGRDLDGRATVLLSMGRVDEARPLIAAMEKAFPTLAVLGMEAGILGDEGRFDEAEKLFVEAEYHYNDVAPFPVAWLWLQEGLMWQKAGLPGRARELFEASLERVPVFAPAISHLATIEAQSGDRDKAITRLRALVATSDDPEYLGQLAELLRADGKKEEADKLHADAQAAFARLLSAHPEAFADHAARFHLGWGGEADEALVLAEQNLGARKTADALQLVVEAALAAGKSDRACAAVDEAIALAPRSAPMHNLAWKAFSACARKDRADAEQRTAASLSHP